MMSSPQKPPNRRASSSHSLGPRQASTVSSSSSTAVRPQTQHQQAAPPSVARRGAKRPVPPGPPQPLSQLAAPTATLIAPDGSVSPLEPPKLDALSLRLEYKASDEEKRLAAEGRAIVERVKKQRTLADRHADAISEVQEKTVRRPSGTIVILSASKLTLALMSSQLKRLGWRVLTATSMIDLPALAKNTRVDTPLMAVAVDAFTDEHPKEVLDLLRNVGIAVPKILFTRMREDQGRGFQLLPRWALGSPDEVSAVTSPTTAALSAAPQKSFGGSLGSSARGGSSRGRRQSHAVAGSRGLLSQEDGYGVGFDIVYDRAFDHSSSLEVTELFLTVAGRSRNATFASSNFVQIRTTLSDVTDRFWTKPGPDYYEKLGKDLDKHHQSVMGALSGEGGDGADHIAPHPMEPGDDVPKADTPDLIDTHPSFVVLQGKYEHCQQVLFATQKELAKRNFALSEIETKLTEALEEKAALEDANEDLKRSLENTSMHSQLAKDRLEMMQKRAYDGARIKSLESINRNVRSKNEELEKTLDATQKTLETTRADLEDVSSRYTKERAALENMLKKVAQQRTDEEHKAASEAQRRDMELRYRRREVDAMRVFATSLQERLESIERNAMEAHDADYEASVRNARIVADFHSGRLVGGAPKGGSLRPIHATSSRRSVSPMGLDGIARDNSQVQQHPSSRAARSPSVSMGGPMSLQESFEAVPSLSSPSPVVRRPKMRDRATSPIVELILKSTRAAYEALKAKATVEHVGFRSANTSRHGSRRGSELATTQGNSDEDSDVDSNASGDGAAAASGKREQRSDGASSNDSDAADELTDTEDDFEDDEEDADDRAVASQTVANQARDASETPPMHASAGANARRGQQQQRRSSPDAAASSSAVTPAGGAEPVDEDEDKSPTEPQRHATIRFSEKRGSTTVRAKRRASKRSSQSSVANDDDAGHEASEPFSPASSAAAESGDTDEQASESGMRRTQSRVKRNTALKKSADAKFGKFRIRSASTAFDAPFLDPHAARPISPVEVQQSPRRSGAGDRRVETPRTGVRGRRDESAASPTKASSPRSGGGGIASTMSALRAAKRINRNAKYIPRGQAEREVAKATASTAPARRAPKPPEAEVTLDEARSTTSKAEALLVDHFEQLSTTLQRGLEGDLEIFSELIRSLREITVHRIKPFTRGHLVALQKKAERLSEQLDRMLLDLPGSIDDLIDRANKFFCIFAERRSVNRSIEELQKATGGLGQKERETLTRKLGNARRRIRDMAETFIGQGDFVSYSEMRLEVLDLEAQLSRWMTRDERIDMLERGAGEDDDEVAQMNRVMPPARNEHAEVIERHILQADDDDDMVSRMLRDIVDDCSVRIDDELLVAVQRASCRIVQTYWKRRRAAMRNEDGAVSDGDDDDGEPTARGDGDDVDPAPASPKQKSLPSLLSNARQTIGEALKAMRQKNETFVRQTRRREAAANADMEKRGMDIRLFNTEIDFGFLKELASPNGYRELTPGSVTQLFEIHHRQLKRLLRHLKDRAPLTNIKNIDASLMERQFRVELNKDGEAKATPQPLNVPFALAADTALIARFADYYQEETEGQHRTSIAKYKKTCETLSREESAQTDAVRLSSAPDGQVLSQSNDGTLGRTPAMSAPVTGVVASAAPPVSAYELTFGRGVAGGKASVTTVGEAAQVPHAVTLIHPGRKLALGGKVQPPQRVPTAATQTGAATSRAATILTDASRAVARTATAESRASRAESHMRQGRADPRAQTDVPVGNATPRPPDAGRQEGDPDGSATEDIERSAAAAAAMLGEWDAIPLSASTSGRRRQSRAAAEVSSRQMQDDAKTRRRALGRQAGDPQAPVSPSRLAIATPKLPQLRKSTA